MASTEGVNIVISGDSSQLIRSIHEAQNALAGMKSRKIDIAVQLTGGLQEMGAKLESLFGRVFKTITAGAISVAGTLGMAVKSALAIGGGFESQITTVKVISGATEQELDMLIKKAREMGATLPISAKDAATAMTLLAQRGTSAKDILASVAEVANLTISQGVDMGSAADLLGSTMTNFGIDIDDAAKVTAVFNNACNQSALSMSKLIEAMKYVGPAAGSVNMSLTEAVSGMEAIANAGLTGEMTGTGLAMVLSKLAASTRIMGVNTKQLDGSLRPLKDIFTDLKNAGFSLTDAIEAFGQRGSKAALALAKNSDKLAENEERLRQWGTTQSAVDAKAKTFTNTMAAFRSAVEELHIEIFEQIKDQSKEAVGSIAELTRAFSDWVAKTQIASKTLNSFLEGLGFNIPSGEDFKKLLQQFDVQAFTDKIKDFGSTIKSIAESIAGFFSKIQTPLLWLIEHLDTFAAISFWGWILGKGLQFPAAILGIASSFVTLAGAAKTLFGLSWTLLANPIGAALVTAGLLGGAAIYAVSKADEAKREEKRIKAEAERIRREVESANKDLMFHVDIDFKTGFEQLPESFSKASAELRQEVRETTAFLQEQFRDKAAQAVDYVTEKFPELSQAFSGTAHDISDEILSKISNALQGSEKDFDALPEIWRKVTERINAVDTGFDKLGVDLLGITQKYIDLQQALEKPIKKTETETFFEELSASIKGITENLSGEIERANKFLNGSDGQLAINVSLSQAQNKLQQFVKSASEKYALPEDIVKTSLINRLNDLALAGNDTAQSLINGFSGAGDTLDTFLASAREAITYLGASPDKFMPALNSMISGIQRIDPLTGKLTEKFKKAHDALKQWSNVTFDQLTNRIQKLRKAVEGGFIDQSALEAEFRRVIPQLKLQVVSDLQPQREQYRTTNDYQAVVASELISRINDLFGDVGMDLARDMFNGKTGADMGRAIVNEVEHGLSGTSGTFQINGVDQLQQGLSSIASLPQNISNAVSPYVAKLEQLSSSSGNSNDNSYSGIKDYSSEIALIVREIQASSTANVSALSQLQNAIDQSSQTQDFSSAIAPVVTELQGISSYLKSVQGKTDNSQDFNSALSPVITALQNISAGLAAIQNTDNISLNESSISQAVASAFSPFIAQIEQNSSVYQSSSAAISRSMQDLSGNIEALRKSTDNSASAMLQLQTSVKSAGDSYSATNITSAVTPIMGLVQNLASTLGAIQSINQANEAAVLDIVSLVRSLEVALKSMNAGNNYNIDINQQGFVVEKKSDADMLARSTVSALRSGIGNGGI